MPDGPQVFRPSGDLNSHKAFNSLAVTPAMAEGTDTADTFRYIYIFLEAPLLHQLFQSPVYVTNGRNCFYHLFVLQLQIQMDRFRQNRMLGTERYYCTFTHINSLLPPVWLHLQDLSLQSVWLRPQD